MATKNSFTLDSNGVTKTFEKIIAYVTKSKVIAISKSGREIATIPLIVVIVVALILPVLFAVVLIAGLALSYKFAIAREVEDEIKLLEK